MSSAVNLGDTPSSHDGAGAFGRPNPVALEVAVNATGTRPGGDAAKRELFSEDTATVLVFVDGAVIRLQAAVAVGQLIFLTNKENNREVVCQVINKRVDRPTSCYVELTFTEEQDNFWGTLLPAASTFMPKAEAAEAVESSEPTEEAGTVTVPPSDEEVWLLRSEVDALREQLKVLMAKPKAEEAEEAAWRAEEDETERKRTEELARESASAARIELAKIGEPAPESAVPAVTESANPADAVPTTPMAAAAPQYPLIEPQAEKESAASAWKPTAMALPMGGGGTAGKADEEEVELPKPALDFSRVARDPMDENDPYSIYAPKRKKIGKWMLAGLTVTLLGALGFAVYQLQLWRLVFARRSAKPAATETVKTKAAASGTAAVPGAVVPGTAGTAGTAAAANPLAGEPAANAATNAPTTPAPAAANGEAAGNPTKAEAAPAATDKADAAKAETAAKHSTESKSGEKKKSAERGGKGGAKQASAEKGGDTPEDAALTIPQSTGGLLIAAKLVKQVAPVYPPDAMRNFITGDVRLSAVVDAEGKVKSVEVLFGPAPLREAAIEAMKQYEYLPATEGGKPVESKVTATIKFWFNP